jgi:hypothetical protein
VLVVQRATQFHKATQFYAGQETTVSPLWRRIASTFQSQFLARTEDDGAEWNEAKLYVRERRPDGGLDEADLHDYLTSPRKRLLVITAPGGLGKTTFLRHVIRNHAAGDAFAVVWVDLLRDLLPPDPDHIDTQVASLISAGLDRSIGTPSLGEGSWIRYFLAHHFDPSGLSALVLAELEATGELRPTSLDSLQHVLRRTDASTSELLRLRLRFVRAVLGKTPVVIIDNVDQLPARAIDALGRLAFALAEGPSSVMPATGEGDGDASAKVVMAMRPLSNTAVQRAVGTVLQGELHPPDIALVLQRRLDWFLEEYDKKILPSRALPVRRGQVRLHELADADPDRLPETVARDLLRQITRVMVSERSPYGDISSLVLKLNNYSTRVCLLATAQYVASGHIDWSGLFHAAQHGRSLANLLTWPKVLRAIFMGVRAVYRSDAGWLYNLFNDGEHDRTSVVIRPRFLKVLASERGGLSARSAATALGRLFGYPEERVDRVQRDTLERGLIHEAAHDRLCITDAGVTYLKMIGEFEYLQHVVMDAWVDGEHLVRAEPDETAEIRYERVLRFAAWVRAIEVEDYRQVARAQLHELYDRYFGEDTLCGEICTSLLVTERVRHAIASEALGPLQNRTRELAARADLAAIRRDAC